MKKDALRVKNGRVKRNVVKHPSGYMPQALQRGQRPVRAFVVYSNDSESLLRVREFEDTSLDVAECEKA